MAHIAGRFHEVNAWGGESEALPPGPDYAFQIEAAGQGQSPTKGTPQLEVTCVVLNEGELNGRKAIFRYTLNLEKDTPRKRLRALIDATGIPMDGNGGIDDQDLIGRVFMADVIHENYDVVDATTGTKLTKTATRIQNERILPGVEQQNAAAPAAVAPAAAPAAPAAPAPQMTRPAAPAAPAAAAAPAAQRPVYAPPGRGAPAAGGGMTRVS